MCGVKRIRVYQPTQVEISGNNTYQLLDNEKREHEFRPVCQFSQQGNRTSFDRGKPFASVTAAQKLQSTATLDRAMLSEQHGRHSLPSFGRRHDNTNNRNSGKLTYTFCCTEFPENGHFQVPARLHKLWCLRVAGTANLSRNRPT